MTAVFEHAIPTLYPPQSPQTHQNPIEIIDLSSPEIPSQDHRTSPQRGTNNLPGSSREVISLLDSDDEDDDEPVIVGSFESRRLPPLLGSRHRIFSPPPPPMDGTIPPVPSVPSRYAGFTAFPVQRRPGAGAAGPSGSSSASGVIRPRSQPLPFEIHAVDEGAPNPIPGPSRLPSPPRAAPPSHHVPAMGFGGALLSTHATRTNTTRPRHPLSNRVARTSRHSFLSRGYHGILSIFGVEDPQDESTGPWWDGDNFTPPQIQLFGPPTAETEDYLPRYTHPSKPEPGFTFNFGASTSETDSKFPPTSSAEPIILDDDDDDDDDSKPSHSAGAAGASSTTTPSELSKLTAVLLCARCQSPLLLNAGLSSEAKDRRVWALRCGHLIDERCLAEIGQPSEYLTNSLGSNDRKGKGKAPPSPRPYAIALSDTGDATATTTAQQQGQHLEVPGESGNIRSRLRSRTQATSPAHAAPGPHSPIPTMATRSGGAGGGYGGGGPSQPPPAKKRRVGANKKSKIQGRHEWKCPVQGCALVHASIKVDDVWGPEKEHVVGREKKDGRGAIPIFT